VSDDSPLSFRYKRDCQSISSAQRIYYELLCVIADWESPEGSYRDFGYGLNIKSRFISYDHFKLLFI